MPDDEAGRIYLVYNNYNVLMKWNRSHYFALAVSIWRIGLRSNLLDWRNGLAISEQRALIEPSVFLFVSNGFLGISVIGMC